MRFLLPTVVSVLMLAACDNADERVAQGDEVLCRATWVTTCDDETLICTCELASLVCGATVPTDRGR